MREPVVTEEQHRAGIPFGESCTKSGIVETTEIFRAGRGRGIGHEFAVVAGNEIDIPLERVGETRVAFFRHTEFPEIEYLEFQRSVFSQPTKPRAVILHWMRKHDRKTTGPVSYTHLRAHE